MGNGTTSQLGTAIEQTLDDNNGTTVVQNSNLGEIVPQTLDIPIDGAVEIPSYLDQIVQNFDTRMLHQDKLTKRWKEGEMDADTGWKGFDDWAGDWNYNIQSFGKSGSGTVMDVLGVGIGAVIDGVQLVMPVTTGAIEDAVSTGWEWTMNTEGGQEAQEAFAGTVKEYKEWKENNPDKAGLFESVVNTGLVLMPVRFKNKLGPVEGSTFATKRSEQLISSALKSEKNTKRSLLERMLTPAVTEKNIKGASTIKGPTPLKGPVLGFNTSEKEVLDYLVSLESVKPSKGFLPSLAPTYSPTQTKIVIDKSQIKLNDEIGKILMQHKDIKIPLYWVKETMKKNIAKKLDTLPYLQGDKTVLTKVDNYIKAANKILNKHKNTPQGVHNARVEWDLFMKNEVNAGILEGSATGIQSMFAKEIRNAMNFHIDAVIPPLNSIAIRRTQQNLNYRAIDMLAPKVAKEGAKLTKFFQNILRVNKGRATAASAAVLMGVPLYGSKVLAYTALSLGGVASIAALTGLAVKGSMSPLTRKTLGVVLREGDKAIRNTANYEMRKSLLSGKAYLSDLVKNMPTENVDASGNPL